MNILEILAPTEREDFNKSWLFETPESLEFSSWNSIRNEITEFRSITNNTQILPNGFQKLDLLTQVFYWFEKNNEIVIGTSLDKQPRSLVVQLTGKNPKFIKQPPYASDLYLAILNDLKNTNRNIVLSDKTLSDEGYGIWKKLFQDGHTVSLYDKNNPSKSFKKFDSIEDMDKYFQTGQKYQDYRFVLSESKLAQIAVYASFRMRKIREDNNLPLNED